MGGAAGRLALRAPLCHGASVSLIARGLAYVAALTLAFAGVAPWVTMLTAVGSPAPAGVAVVLTLALALVLATVRRVRGLVGLLAVITAGFALIVVWAVPDALLLADMEQPGVQITGAGAGLLAMMGAAVLAFAASALPTPAARRRGEREEPAPHESG